MPSARLNEHQELITLLFRFGSIVSGAYADHALLPPGKYITMYVPLCCSLRVYEHLTLLSHRFQYLEYPASRGRIHITSQSPYVEPTFDSGFMNNKADFAPIRWCYKRTREIARRMDGACRLSSSGR